MKNENREMKQMIKDQDKKWQLDKEIVRMVTEKMMEEWNEKEEKERKNYNLIIHNLPEDRRLSQREQNEKDRENCRKIIDELGLHVEEEEIVETARLGWIREEEDEHTRPRVILVKMTEAQKKWKIIKNTKRLRESRNEEYKSVFIGPDLTVKERKAEKELRS